ncbi:MAG: DUF1847 domain-containing protein [Bacteroidales bacterium]
MTNCAGCKSNACYQGEGCSRGYDFESYIAPTRNEYSSPDNLKPLKVSTHIEGTHYMEWTRLEEIIGYAGQMGYSRIGIAHCTGLSEEAKCLKEILDRKFETHTIGCKFTGISKDEFELTKIIEHRREAICNSIGQAMVLNDLKTDLNIIVGLCMGHDILFTRYSDADVTTFIVKDRVTGHNPVATLYSNYYRKKFKSIN